MSSATLPPPLSDAPTVDTLERLLVGLHQPVERGVPSPPAADGPLHAGMFEPAAPVTHTAATATTAVAPPPVAPEPVAPAPSPTPPPAPAPDRVGATSLSWSAAHVRRRRRTSAATALGVAVVTAAGVVAGLVVTGEVPLP